MKAPPFALGGCHVTVAEPPNREARTKVGGLGGSTMRNHSLRKPNIDLNDAPVTLTLPSLPCTVSDVTRPPHAPLPSRPVMTIDCTAPTEKAERMPAADRVVRQECGLQLTSGTPSYGSFCAMRYGWPPDTVHPPDDDENCVKAASRTSS